jgi:hypothetical protein
MTESSDKTLFHGVNFWVPQNKEHFTSQEALRHSRTILLHGVKCWVLTGPSSGSPLQASTSGVQNEGNHGSMPQTLVPPTWCEHHICCPVTPIKINVKLNYPYLKHVKFLKSNLLPTSRFFSPTNAPFY